MAASGVDTTQKGVGVHPNTTTSKTKNAPTNPPTNPGKPDRMNPAQKQRQALKAKMAPTGETAPKDSESEDIDYDVEEYYLPTEVEEEIYVNLTIMPPVPNA